MWLHGPEHNKSRLESCQAREAQPASASQRQEESGLLPQESGLPLGLSLLSHTSFA